ncbi:MAG: hypothetical protein Q9162_000891 [Coniocarpon cinnabarinum]
MASTEAQRNFQKLKLDTSGWHVPPRPDDVDAPGIPVPASQVLGRTGQRDRQTHVAIPEEIEEEHPLVLDNSQSGTLSVPNDELHHVQDDVARERDKPINQQHTIEKRSSRRRGGGRSMMQELAQSYAQTNKTSTDPGSIRDGLMNGNDTNGENGIDDANGAPDDSPPEFRRGELRWPLLQETTDELADEGRIDKEMAFTPGSVISPNLEGSRTPGYFFFGEHSVSPSIASSPVQPFPSLSGSTALTSPKTRSSSRKDTLERPIPVRRESRRSSAKSSLAKSPASSFLSQFVKANATTEPDEDGQTIGDFGEYVIGRQIGYGGFSTIKEVYSLENQTQVMRAVKIVRKQVNDKKEDENERLQSDFSNEVSIWRLLRHENLLPLVAVFSNPFATFCIMEMNTGGTLFDLVRSNRRRGSSTFSPRAIHAADASMGHDSMIDGPGIPLDLARHYLRQLASALRYLHQDMHIVHRDVKLENCLVSSQSLDLSRDPSMKVRLCDFGMADFITADGREEPVFDTTYLGQMHQPEANGSPHIIGPSDLSTNIAGSLEYASPELIHASKPLFNPCIDIWALGILAHALFTADLPFRHSLPERVQMMIMNGLWDRRPLSEACGPGSPGYEFVERCLEMDASKRWDIQKIVDCKFLT